MCKASCLTDAHSSNFFENDITNELMRKKGIITFYRNSLKMINKPYNILVTAIWETLLDPCLLLRI